jgi:hypothetical protein
MHKNRADKLYFAENNKNLSKEEELQKSEKSEKEDPIPVPVGSKSGYRY